MNIYIYIYIFLDLKLNQSDKKEKIYAARITEISILFSGKEKAQTFSLYAVLHCTLQGLSAIAFYLSARRRLDIFFHLFPFHCVYI